MKLFALSLIASLIPLLSISQLKLTPRGLVDETDLSKEYIVIDFEGYSKADLYNSYKSYVLKSFNSPKHVVDEVENTSIRITGSSDKIIGSYKTSPLDKFSTSVGNYIVLSEFKDGRVKFSVLQIDWHNQGFGSGYDFVLVGDFKKLSSKRAIFNSSGELDAKWEWLKNGTEKFFNDYIEAFSKEIKTQNDW